MLSEQLSERITFRLSYAERRAIENAARAYGMEPGRLIRKLLERGLRDLKPVSEPPVNEALKF